LNAFLNVDKPSGPSSFGVVKRIRSATGVRKVGHAGTLDPQASGVLVCALGNATRVLPYLDLEPKVYEFDLTFGCTTDTLDGEGEIVDSGGIIPSEMVVAGALERFLGESDQIPPRYSAVKIMGKPAYKRARQNETFSIRARTVRISTFELLDSAVAPDTMRFRVVCSGGTYVRSLARDLAEALSTLGFASRIRRTGVGPFRIEDAVSWDDLCRQVPIPQVGLHEIVDESVSTYVDDRQSRELGFGRAVPSKRKHVPGTTVFLFDSNNELVSIAEAKPSGDLQPKRVFAGRDL